MHANPTSRQSYARLPLSAALSLFAVLAIPAASHAQQVITFDAPNSGTNQFIGTEASGINIWGTIIGDVTDNSGGTHGFVRSPWGQFAEFDVPGASTAPGYNCLYLAGGTCPIAINDFGVVTGYFGDANGAWHGFVRTPEGKITVFDVAGASTSAGEGTFVQAINNFGVIAGFYDDENNLAHGFLRTPDGRIETFEDPAAGTGAFQGTFPESINDLGMTSGWETDSNGFDHGFVRTAGGETTTFDPPGDAGSTYGFDNGYINDLGVVAGSYWLGSGNVAYGFQRAPDGKITVYQLPDAGTQAFDGAYIGGVNIAGTTTGYVTDENVENHSFVRSANGKTIVFDIPGQLLQVNSGFGSAGEAINAVGVIAGRWHDTNLLLHGFIRLPN